MTTKDQALEGLRLAVRHFFPDERAAPIGMALLEQIARALPEEVQESLFGEVLGVITGADVPAVEDDQILGYYAAYASHARFGVHRFVEALSMVAVHVPQSKADIATKIGIVYAGDHPRYTLGLVQDGYARAMHALASRARASGNEERAAYLFGRAARALEIDAVERYTPARYFGARFGAVAVDVLFSAGKPFAYRMTGGMATGESMVDYTSPAMGETIYRSTGYQPTPLSDPHHVYDGIVTLDARNVLTSFQVEPSERAGAKPYAKINARLEPIDPIVIHPSICTARAAMRMATVCEWLGRPFPGVPDFVAKILAAAGRDLPWEERPDA